MWCNGGGGGGGGGGDGAQGKRKERSMSSVTLHSATSDRLECQVWLEEFAAICVMHIEILSTSIPARIPCTQSFSFDSCTVTIYELYCASFNNL